MYTFAQDSYNTYYFYYSVFTVVSIRFLKVPKDFVNLILNKVQYIM